jgi:hypothetical protein
MSLTRFAQLLALGALGLAGLLALGVGGVVLVQGYAFPAPRIGIREPGLGRLRFPSAALEYSFDDPWSAWYPREGVAIRFRHWGRDRRASVVVPSV